MPDRDIITLIAEFRNGFRALNMEPPIAIILATNEDGMRLLGEIGQRQFLILPAAGMGTPIAHPDGSLWMEIEIYSCKVRWPANRIAVRGRGYVFV